MIDRISLSRTKAKEGNRNKNLPQLGEITGQCTYLKQKREKILILKVKVLMNHKKSRKKEHILEPLNQEKSLEVGRIIPLKGKLLCSLKNI